MSNPSSPSPEQEPPLNASSPPPPPEPTLALPAPPLATSTPPTTATVTPNPRRLPPPCWSHDETVALIDAYRDKWYTLRRGNLKATHWQEVADAVARRCPMVSPPKTAVQCRHKMEKLRKRYRTEIQRARSMPVSRFASSWVHFKRMDSMEKGPSVKPDYNSDSPDEDNDEDDEEDQDQDFYEDGYKNGNVHTRSVQKLYRNGIPNSGGSVSGSGGGGGSSGGFRIRIPTGVSIAQPAPRYYGKMDQKYGANSNSNPNPSPNPHPNKANFGGSGYGTRVLRGFEETPGKAASSGKRERDAVSEMVSAIKVLGDGFVRMEQMKMEMAREIETMRMEMEMKRTEMILDSQQRIVEAFAKAVSERKKKPKRMPSPES